MTHHQDIQPPTTLAEVLDVLKSNPDPDKKRQQSKLSAISRVSAYMSRPPSDIPTDIPQLRKLLASLHPAACGVKLPGLLALGASQNEQSRPGAACSRLCSTALVAGAGFEPATFRL